MYYESFREPVCVNWIVCLSVKCVKCGGLRVDVLFSVVNGPIDAGLSHHGDRNQRLLTPSETSGDQTEGQTLL